MFEFVRVHQLNLMLFLAGMCGITAFYALLSKTLPAKRKIYIIYLELDGMILMLADRFAYIFRGDESTLGYWMVRITNFLVFFISLSVIHAFNLLFADILREKGNLGRVPMELRFVEIFISIGELLLIVSQFTGLYYTFDETNHYKREPGLFVCYACTLLSLGFQLICIIKYRKNLRRRLRFGFLAFTIAPIISTIAQIFLYGLSLTNITIVIILLIIYTFTLIDINETAELATQSEIDYLKKESVSIKRLFEQTASALATAIDAKDSHTHGHSARVADYARRIAVEQGKTEKECDEIYYAALLHDVGKIGIPDDIIAKSSRLTDEEYEEVQQHVSIGEEILSSITEFPYLSIAAKYHHERYDGTGYPDKLAGENIPEIARIISVADAYDVMTSKRKYRDAGPQEKVREEIIKGTGTQFDPVFANTMLHLIDMDYTYEMKERTETIGLAGNKDLHPAEYRSKISDGIIVDQTPVKIHISCKPDEDTENEFHIPALVLYDSLDGKIYYQPDKIEDLSYLEFGELWFDGNKICSGARDIQVKTEYSDREKYNALIKSKDVIEYDIEAVKIRDHAKIVISSKFLKVEAIIALPDAVRYMYAALTGEYCYIYNISVDKAKKPVPNDYIPRIAEEISYIDRLEGDVPNIQIEGYHFAKTDGVPVRDGMRIEFHTMCLPTARLIWHCPHIILFYSDDKKVDGKNYREFALIRLDGEYWDSKGHSENKMITNFTENFESWDAWKELNKKGYNCELEFKRFGSRVTLTTENGGIAIKNITNIPADVKDMYVSLSGDQVALTEIRYL
ncbi:HD-GYP domain-containing protein [Butyrivibrio sp. WCE2006]|uniref:HD-GYP domain-containing protein n=1 Tax=Butyrivibrio sp. WCE2006 TaxID=1410611 RepID=UPI0005D184B2|nr:HD-GYP domain-containing protein [Butyrivibrio sp. WCE2006]